jgi:hypothetical protein
MFITEPDLAVAPIRFAAGRAGSETEASGERPHRTSRSIAFPPPSVRLCNLPLSRCPHGASRTVRRVRPIDCVAWPFHPRDRCASPFPTLHDPCCPTLSRRTSSPGVVKVRPSVVCDRGVHLESRSCRHARPARTKPPLRPCSAHVVSHHLDGLLLHDRAGMLHPTADPGVRRVSACCAQASSRRVLALQSFEPPSQRPACTRRCGRTGHRHRGCRRVATPTLPFTGALASPPLGSGRLTPPAPSTSRPCSMLEAGVSLRVAALRTLPCSPGLRPRRCRCCHHAPMSPSLRAPVARCAS